MQSYFAKTVLLASGWAEDMIIAVNNEGWITDIKKGRQANASITFEGPVLPGMVNIHSHAFQRAMAGLTERMTGEKDSFWTWRTTMYKFLEQLTPEDQHAIAAQVYVEMLKAGFTTVAEFHYLHHQTNGSPYEDRALISHSVINAAQTAGIAITHLPVLYAYSGFGNQAPLVEQKRFINDVDQILNILTALKITYKNNPQITIGLGHHSLRAVSVEMIAEATSAMQKIDINTPIHIHIAEQEQEVKNCLEWCRKRPVEWLLENINVDKHWCLVHATHMTQKETHALAKSNAVAGLCPVTEANLGDGLFNLPAFVVENGRFGIGTDSNISVNMIEELRLLEYGQRLLHQQRSILKTPSQTSVGTFLYHSALQGGAQAAARLTGEIAVGKRADFIALDSQAPILVGKHDDTLLDAMIFAVNNNPIRHVIAGGKYIVQDFHHIGEKSILNNYKNTMQKLIF